MSEIAHPRRLHRIRCPATTTPPTTGRCCRCSTCATHHASYLLGSTAVLAFFGAVCEKKARCEKNKQYIKRTTRLESSIIIHFLENTAFVASSVVVVRAKPVHDEIKTPPANQSNGAAAVSTETKCPRIMWMAPGHPRSVRCGRDRNDLDDGATARTDRKS